MSANGNFIRLAIASAMLFPMSAHAQSDDTPLAWRFERVWSTQGRSGIVPENLLPHQLGTDRAGRIYLLDTDRQLIQVLNASGRTMRTIGGPGALPAPMALHVDTDGNVAVYDLARSAVVRWDSAGNKLPEIRLPVPYWGPRLRLTADQVIFIAKGKAAGTHELVSIENGGASVLLEYPAPRKLRADFPACNLRSVTVSQILAPAPAWDAGNELVAVADSLQYAVELFSNGKRVRMLRREIPPRKLTEELVLEHVSEGMMIGSGCTVPAREAVRARGFAAQLAAVSDILFGPRGTVWVRRASLKGEPVLIDVFNVAGKYLGTAPAHSTFPAAFIGDDRFVALEKSAAGDKFLAVYRIHR